MARPKRCRVGHSFAELTPADTRKTNMICRVVEALIDQLDVAPVGEWSLTRITDETDREAKKIGTGAITSFRPARRAITIELMAD